jgi:predicted amidohydrolase
MFASVCIAIFIGLIGGEPGAQARDGEAAPGGWKTYATRTETAPEFRIEPSREESSPPSYRLVLSGRGDPAVDGRWVRTVPVQSGRWYAFRAEYQARRVPAPARSILARLIWLDAKGNRVEQPEYPLTSLQPLPASWIEVSGRFKAPEKAEQAQLELHMRWAAQGEVAWKGAELTESTQPAPRRVRLAAVNHRPKGSKSSEENLEHFAGLVDLAASQKADIVCLPEGITVVGTRRSYAEAAEPIPGPSTQFLAEVAKRNKVYVVAGLYERERTTLYNTSVLLGRDGTLVGKYRKVCLPREEIDGGLTPGRSYPVFDTDFGRVGMMICWDLHYPEVARELAARGAEVILMPIWGGNDTLARARAIENQLYLVASGYDFKTAIFDKTGASVAQAERDPAVIITEVDLSAREMWPWLGDWRSRIWREGPQRTDRDTSP